MKVGWNFIVEDFESRACEFGLTYKFLKALNLIRDNICSPYSDYGKKCTLIVMNSDSTKIKKNIKNYP